MIELVLLVIILLLLLIVVFQFQKLTISKDNTEQDSVLRKELRDINSQSTDNLRKTLEGLGKAQQDVLEGLGKSQQDHLINVSKNIKELKDENEKKLDEMREVVDEKLQKTLEKRITASFEIVTKQLQDVHSGLGEMKNLAEDVGGLKKVLSNVSTRGALGELQAHQILENFLSPEQYGVNVQTNPNYNGTVEFAVALPGAEDSDEKLWLPIDCKFPIEDHQKWLDSLETGDKELIKKATKALISNVKSKAETISSKYIAPPHTTEFAVMFLPTEGLYADIARQPGVIEVLQRDYNILICGPSNLSAFISSIKVGFRTLALKESAGDVWKVLGQVKSEFVKFGTIIEKAHKQANTVTKTLSSEGDVQVRLRAMNRALKEIESLPLSTSKNQDEDDDEGAFSPSLIT